MYRNGPHPPLEPNCPVRTLQISHCSTQYQYYYYASWYYYRIRCFLTRAPIGPIGVFCRAYISSIRQPFLTNLERAWAWEGSLDEKERRSVCVAGMVLVTLSCLLGRGAESDVAWCGVGKDGGRKEGDVFEWSCSKAVQLMSSGIRNLSLVTGHHPRGVLSTGPSSLYSSSSWLGQDGSVGLAFLSQWLPGL